VCMSPAPRACHYLFSWPQSNHGSNPNQIPVGVYIGVVFKHSGTAVREKDTVVCPWWCLLRMHIYMCLYTRINNTSIHLFIHVYTSIHRYMHKSIHHAHTHTHTCVHTHHTWHTHHKYICIHKYAWFVYMYVYIYVYVCIYIYTCTFI